MSKLTEESARWVVGAELGTTRGALTAADFRTFAHDRNLGKEKRKK